MGGKNSVERRVEMAQKTGVVNFKEMNLKKFPTQLLQIPNLRTLDISDNAFSDGINCDLSQLSALKSLILSRCKLYSLPVSIYRLKKLETLDVHGNFFTEVSEAIGDMAALKSINLSNNRLKRLPHTINTLRHLNILECGDNKISSLPDSFSTCTAVEINLNRNSLSTLPLSIKDCSRLKTLRLEENCLSIDDNLRAILKSSAISLLCLDGNLFTNKQLENLEEFAEYTTRFTATKKKIF